MTLERDGTNSYVAERLAEINGTSAPTVVTALPDAPVVAPKKRFAIRVTGPGVDMHLSVDDISDLDIVDMISDYLRRRIES